MIKLTAFVLVLCSVLAFSSALCTPDKWEGIETSLGGYAGFWRHGLIEEYIRVSYDAINNRTAAFLDYVNNGHSRKFKIVTRYDNATEAGKTYILDLKTDRCWTKTVRRPFRRACIPDDAKPIVNYTIGLPGNGINATGYVLKFKKINAMLSVQEVGNDEFVPIGESITGRVGKYDFVQTVGFVDISGGIKNETVFNVPKQCQKEEDSSPPEELTREHYILAI